MKITQTTLKQIIKEETEKVILAEDIFGSGGFFDNLMRRGTEDGQMASDEEEAGDEEQERKLSALDDDSRSDEEKFENLKAKYIKMVKAAKRYKKYVVKAEERILRKKKEVEQEMEDEYLDKDDDDDAGEIRQIRLKLLAKPQERLAKIQMRLAKIEARAKDYYDKAISLKQLIKAKAEEKAQQADDGADQGASDSWVGKSRRDVLKALQDEFKIKPIRNWYKKLPMRHPARVKFREWYKASRGK